MEKDSTGEKIFLAGIYIFLTIVTLSVLYPLIYIVSSSFSSATAIRTGQVYLWPVNPTLEGYNLILQNKLLLSGYLNSILYTVSGTLISLILTIFAAFSLSKSTLIGRNYIMFFYAFTMFFTGGLIPTYMVVKSLSMVDTFWALIIPNALSVWNVVIALTFFKSTLTKEMLEAAEIDGCGNIQTLFRIVLPVSKPIIAVLCLFTAIVIWNSYFDALIYLHSQKLYPLQLVLRQVLIQSMIKASDFSDPAKYVKLKNAVEVMKFSTIVVASLPTLILFPFVQRHFVKGVMIGSIKG